MTAQKFKDHDWRQHLTPEQYDICREKGTEPAFSGEYWNTQIPGVYVCRCCQQPLFDSSSKFDAGCGWPSFDAPINEQGVEERADYSHGMTRTEVECEQCGCHLGHVFPDGPTQTGLRYCINSASVSLQSIKEWKENSQDKEI